MSLVADKTWSNPLVIPGLRMAELVKIYSNAIVCQADFLASSEIHHVNYPKNAFASIRGNLKELEMVTGDRWPV